MRKFNSRQQRNMKLLWPNRDKSYIIMWSIFRNRRQENKCEYKVSHKIKLNYV